MKHFTLLLKKIDHYFDKHTMLWLLLAVLTVLRVPNFFDPYWYGDEAIYLTVGQSIRAGQQLYSEIVDHKTPIIYYLAAVPNQFWFRVLLYCWMIVSTALFYSLAKRLFKRDSAVFASSLGFVLLTTLPWFEGHIPNGELFVLGFVLAGLWLLMRAGFFSFLEKKTQENSSFHQSRLNIALSLTAGAMYGLGVLTKVPAILDIAAIILVPWFYFTNQVKALSKKLVSGLVGTIKSLLPYGVGVMLPILLSIAYFVLIGAGRAYLEFGLLYNLHYSQTWTQDFGGALLNFLFTLPGKTLLLAVLLLALTLVKQLSLKLKFFAGWYLLTLYAVLLSNRPYPHYFIQSVPPLVLLFGWLVEQIANTWQKKKAKLVSTGMIFGGLVILTTSIFLKVGFNPYPTAKYYQNFLRFAKGKLDQKQYYQTFNYLMSDNYKLTEFLKAQDEDRLYIWGNNAMLYALSQTVPTSRFTVAFHVQDLKVYDETIEEIMAEEPKYIVVMKNAPAHFPRFYQYLANHYLPSYEYEYMTLYKRTATH